MTVKDTNIRFVLRLPYKIRSLLIRGLARRILSAGRSSTFNEIPSINLLINEIIEDRLGLPISIPKQIIATKRTVLMFYLRKRLQEALKNDSQVRGIPQNQILKKLIEDTDLSTLSPIRISEIDDEEEMIGCSFGLPFECRSKLIYEIAIRLLNTKTGIGKSEFASIGDIVNELLAYHYKLPMPLEKAVETYVDSEIINFVVCIPVSLHQALRAYCEEKSSEGKFTSMNKVILDWCELIGEREKW